MAREWLEVLAGVPSCRSHLSGAERRADWWLPGLSLRSRRKQRGGGGEGCWFWREQVAAGDGRELEPGIAWQFRAKRARELWYGPQVHVTKDQIRSLVWDFDMEPDAPVAWGPNRSGKWLSSVEHRSRRNAAYERICQQSWAESRQSFWTMSVSPSFFPRGIGTWK